MAVQTKPDVAVIDVSMPVVNGIEATRQIRARLPKTEVLIFTIHADEMLISDMLGAGARGYILNTDLMGHLLEAIYSLALHKPFFTAKVSETRIRVLLGRRRHDFSERERSMVQMIAEGHTNNQMAKVLQHRQIQHRETTRCAHEKARFNVLAEIVRCAVRNGASTLTGEMAIQRAQLEDEAMRGGTARSHWSRRDVWPSRASAAVF